MESPTFTKRKLQDEDGRGSPVSLAMMSTLGNHEPYHSETTKGDSADDSSFSGAQEDPNSSRSEAGGAVVNTSLLDLNSSNFFAPSQDEEDDSVQRAARDEQRVQEEFDRMQDNATLDTVEQQQTLIQLATEHKIFLHAALALLTERDLRAPTLGMMNPVVLKAGPLKKASHLMHGVWKVKYVEIRRGMFSYYENQASAQGDGGILRKNVPLTASDCVCRAVRLHKKALKFTPRGAIFELSAGGSKRLWMAASTQERYVWMQAIRNATVGGSVTTSTATAGELDANDGEQDAGRDPAAEGANGINGSSGTGTGDGGNSVKASTTTATGEPFDHRGRIRVVSPKSPFRQDLRLYLRIQSLLKSANSKVDYIAGLREILHKPIKVPIQWIVKQTMMHNHSTGGNNSSFSTSDSTVAGVGGGSSSNPNRAFDELEVDLSVEQLWRDLQRDLVSINGQVWQGSEPNGPQRILGALAHSILRASLTKPPPTTVTSDEDDDRPKPIDLSNTRPTTDMMESQALAYARDIMLAGNRTRSGGDSYFCISELCNNPELVVVVPSSTEVEPVTLAVVQEKISPHFASPSYHAATTKTGWIKRRTKLQRKWKKFFFALTEGTLSFYQGAIPRPNGLRGVITMTDAAINVVRREPRGAGKETGTVRNDTSGSYFVLTILSKDGKENLLRFDSEAKLLDWTYALESESRAMLGWESAKRKMRRKSSNSSREEEAAVAGTNGVLDGPTLARIATEAHAEGLGLDLAKVQERIALSGGGRRPSPAVRVSIQACTEYNICSIDPVGDKDQDTWATIKTYFLQNFRVSGGPTGRIVRGEEIVRVSVTKCGDFDSTDVGPLNPASPRHRHRSRLFRKVKDTKDASSTTSNNNAPQSTSELSEF